MCQMPNIWHIYHTKHKNEALWDVPNFKNYTTWLQYRCKFATVRIDVVKILLFYYSLFSLLSLHFFFSLLSLLSYIPVPSLFSLTLRFPLSSPSIDSLSLRPVHLSLWLVVSWQPSMLSWGTVRRQNQACDWAHTPRG